MQKQSNYSNIFTKYNEHHVGTNEAEQTKHVNLFTDVMIITQH